MREKKYRHKSFSRNYFRVIKLSTLAYKKILYLKYICTIINGVSFVIKKVVEQSNFKNFQTKISWLQKNEKLLQKNEKLQRRQQKSEKLQSDDDSLK